MCTITLATAVTKIDRVIDNRATYILHAVLTCIELRMGTRIDT